MKQISLFAYESLVRIVNRRRAAHNIVNRKQYVSPKVRFTVILCWSIPFFDYKSTDDSIKTKTDELPGYDNKLTQKIIKADELLLANKYEEVVRLLEEFKDEDNVKVLLRLTKAKYNMSLDENLSLKKQQSLISSGCEFITKAITIDPNVAELHKWAAILIHAQSNINYSTKEKIINMEIIKLHLKKAWELNPKDPYVRYMIGVWCYDVANISWLQRELGSFIFGADIPSSTFEEALGYFREAESLRPKFYCKNLLMLGKTFLKMDNKFSAEYYLKLVVQYPAKTVEDHQAKLEAEKILKSLKF